MLKLILASTIATLVLITANYLIPPVKRDFQQPQLTKNPLDRILGELWRNDGTIRKNNFDSILHIPAKHLTDSSEHYNIQQLRPNTFLLKRKKFYLDNRNYSLIVETKNKRIVAVHPFNDLVIQDAVYADNQLFILQGDYTEIASHWRPSYSIKISCLDANLQELWNVSSITHKGAFFIGNGIKLKDQQLIVDFEIQREGSSTMCVSSYVLSISKTGEVFGFTGGIGSLCGSEPIVELDAVPKLFEYNGKDT